MKAKSIFQCAALLTGLLFLNVPLFAAVESDIVGYTTISMEAGKWYQVGYPFSPLDGAESIKLNDCFTEGFALEDTLMILDVVNSSYEAMLYWVLQYNRNVEVLSPESLRQNVIASLKKSLALYQKD